MAIISFWSEDKDFSGQTLSLVAISTQMCIEHNMRTLIIDAVFNDDTLERCFWDVNQNRNLANTLNLGKVDIASGAEGLVSAIASNKASPEIISSYTKIIFNNRLDVLPGLKTRDFREYEKLLVSYKELIKAANKYYDLVFIDLSKGFDNEVVKEILDDSAVIIYTMRPNLKQIDKFINFKSESPIFKKGNVIPVYTICNDSSKYNVKNATRYIGEKNLICSIPYNTLFMESACEAKVKDMFVSFRLSSFAQDKNMQFLNSVSACGKSIIYKLQELKYKV